MLADAFMVALEYAILDSPAPSSLHNKANVSPIILTIFSLIDDISRLSSSIFKYFIIAATKYFIYCIAFHQ